ncbi:Crp/Fnr family transcriptional regulator [Reichenbachiella versicolor]|uniref:Crp/Fnr family transcriptional regulator n=1 Tax=Reichenbachiella versicolor TaxID=1821036 RepID=UPI001C87D6CD|nr:Crp/Fnr family transcriptional regulator [Reichenbachiella versicolor]
MEITPLKNYIQTNVDFSEAELDTFCSYFTQKTVSKKDFLLKQGNICRFEGFVIKGCFRLFSLDKEGRENVLYFAIKNWWVTDIDSFTNQKPAHLSIQALEDSEILLINKTNKDRLYTELPKVEQLFRIMTQKTLVSLQRRLIRNHSDSAQERYDHFVTTYPEINQKITDRQVAAYLGITHEFVSKIRNKRMQKKIE